MQRTLGIETEYGITVDGADSVDVVAESIALVRSYTKVELPTQDSAMKWDYNLEDPHQDARGFRAAELLQDTDEAAYFELDKSRPLSFAEIKSDLVLSNGARFYNDHAHPEYCTPECSALDDLVAHDRAGERILMACAHRLSEQRGSKVRLYKNNTDFRGHSYGCHENYLLPRSLPWETLVEGIQAFLVTRQIIAGAGKFIDNFRSGVRRFEIVRIHHRARRLELGELLLAHFDLLAGSFAGIGVVLSHFALAFV